MSVSKRENFQPFLRHFYWWSVRDKDKKDFLLVYQRVSKRQLPEVYNHLWNLSTPSILAYEQAIAFGFYLASQPLITPSAAAHGKNYWNPCLPGSSFAYRIVYLHCLRSFKNQIITYIFLIVLFLLLRRKHARTAKNNPTGYEWLGIENLHQVYRKNQREGLRQFLSRNSVRKMVFFGSKCLWPCFNSSNRLIELLFDMRTSFRLLMFDFVLHPSLDLHPVVTAQ